MTQHTYQTRFTDQEVLAIVSALQSLPAPPLTPNVVPLVSNPALKVLDCVLSLNRRYEEFVVPKLKSFRRRNPEVISLSDLDNLKDARGGAYGLFLSELQYDYYARAQVCDWVLTYLIKVKPQYPGGNEAQSLHNWAVSVKPRDYQGMSNVPGINLTRPRGFAIAGWQYLRMLFGADTCKPDRHILAFLKDTIKRNVDPLHAVEVMEKTAPMAGLTVRDADLRIWTKYSKAARSKRTGTCPSVYLPVAPPKPIPPPPASG